MAFDVAACRARLRAQQEHQYQAREQKRQAVLQALCAAARSIFPHFSRIQRAYLFGTVLRPGALRSASDIDIAVEGRLTAEDYFALWRALERAVGYWPIDLVELDRHMHFTDRVREQGMLIYEHSHSDAEGRYCR
jgi:predicted nucleotidyltransferase